MKCTVRLIFSTLALALGGCAAPDLLSSKGLVTENPPEYSKYIELQRSYETSFDNPYDTSTALHLLNAGLTALHDNCLDYFSSEGRIQQVIFFSRDATAALVPIAGGALALRKASANTIGILTLSTSAANGLISVAAQEFLFGADNIKAVQDLTINGLATHADAVRQSANDHANAVTFDWVTSQLRDNQTICEPQSILSTVRDAIKAGKLAAFSIGNNAGGTPGLTDKQITEFYAKLATAIGVQAIDANEAAALYWLFEIPGAEANISKIANTLLPLAEKSPIKDNKLDRKWTPTDKVKALLEGADVLIKGQLLAAIGKSLTVPHGGQAVARISARIEEIAPVNGALPTSVGVHVLGP